MDDWHLVALSGLVASPWRNGGGTTRDIATVLGAVGGALVLFFGVADGWRDYPDWYIPAMVVTTVLGGAALLAGLAAAAADTDLRWAREHILGAPGPVAT